MICIYYIIYIYGHTPLTYYVYIIETGMTAFWMSQSSPCSMCASEPHDAMALLDTCHACGEPRSCVTGDSLGVFHQISGEFIG